MVPGCQGDFRVAVVGSIYLRFVAGYESAVVVAHDWGGVITWNFASTYPDMCDKVIIMNAPHTYAFAKVIGKSYKQLLASW